MKYYLNENLQRQNKQNDKYLQYKIDKKLHTWISVLLQNEYF